MLRVCYLFRLRSEYCSSTLSSCRMLIHYNTVMRGDDILATNYPHEAILTIEEALTLELADRKKTINILHLLISKKKGMFFC